MAPKNRKVNEAEFASLVAALARDIVDAHIHWGQYKALQAERKRWPDVEDLGWSFWNYASSAHRRTAISRLAPCL